MNHLDRRQALRYFASPLVFGLSGTVADLLGIGQNPTPRPPRSPWLRAALERAATTRTPLVAVVLPDRIEREPVDPARAEEKAAFENRLRLLLRRRPEKELRVNGDGALPAKGGMASWSVPFELPLARFLVHLQLLLENPRYELTELFVEATWVVVRRDQVGAVAGESVVELDQRGRRIAGVMVDLADEREFERVVGRMLHGSRRFRQRAEEALTPDVKSAILDLGNPQRREAAAQALHARFERHRSALIQARLQYKNVDVIRGLREVIAAEHAKATTQGIGGPLPFGVELREQHLYDPCPPCGMARVPAASRKLLSALAYQDK